MIVLQGAKQSVEILAFSPDGRTLVAPCRQRVQVWNLPVADGTRPSALDYESTWAVRFTPDGEKLVLLLGGARLVVHDLRTGEAEHGRVECEGWFTAFALSPDGRFIVVAQWWPHQRPAGRIFCRSLADPAESLWSVEIETPIQGVPMFLGGDEEVASLEWRGLPSVPLRVTRDIQTGQARLMEEVTGEVVYPQVLSMDGRLIAFRRSNGFTVGRCDDLRAEPVAVRNDSRREFTGLAFHPSGRYLAATSNDATVKLYDTATWKLAQAFDWDIGRLRSVAFSADGMLAAAGGDKGKIVVWDVDL